MRCIDLPPWLVGGRKWVYPLCFIGPPESKDLDRVIQELVMELRDMALNGFTVTLPDGQPLRIRVFPVGFICDSRGAEKLEQRGGAGKRLPCSICRCYTSLVSSNGRTYPGGFANRIKVLQERVDLMLHVGEEEMYLTHEQIMQQGRNVDHLIADAGQSRAGNGARVAMTRLKELRTSSGVNRLSLVYQHFPWASGLTFFRWAPLHTCFLRLMKNFWSEVYPSVVGPTAAFRALKLMDRRLELFLRVPTEYQRGVKTSYTSATTSASGSTPFSGWVCEHWCHFSETFQHPVTPQLFAHPVMDESPDSAERTARAEKFHLLEHMLGRLTGFCTFVMRGGCIHVSADATHEEVERINHKLKRMRHRAFADIFVYCALLEDNFDPMHLKYVSHFAACKGKKQMELCGHPSNENWMEQMMGDMKGGGR
jgi:hypothetical protein